MKPAVYQYLLWGASLVIQIALLAAFAANDNIRRYRIAAGYIFVLLGTTLADIGVRTFTTDRRGWYVLFWCGELVRQSAMFAVIVDLMVRYLREYRARRVAATAMVGAAAAFWALSLLIHHDDQLNEWMTPVVRNLSFGTAVLAMMLWSRMIRHDERDTLDLALAGGLGLQMTGEAMAHSLPVIAPSLRFAAAWVTVIAHFLCLIVWWQALTRSSRNKTRVARA